MAAKKMIHVRVTPRSELALKTFCSENKVTVTEAIRQALNVAYANKPDWIQRIRLAQDEQFAPPAALDPAPAGSPDTEAPW